jgi:hypothetical protein
MHEMQTISEPVEQGEVLHPPGWKYKSFKIGPITIPYYASPQFQLFLVAMVCFLCPGYVKELLPVNINYYSHADNAVQNVQCGQW